jgi:hypothetical protein
MTVADALATRPNGATSDAIASLTGLSARAVRAALEALRASGRATRAHLPGAMRTQLYKPIVAAQTQHLVADPEPLRIYERRNHDCARLYDCEAEWIASHGGEQARCSRHCHDFVEREAEAGLEDSSGGG